MAHKTCLAGAGVYDSGREKAVSKLDQLFVDGSAFVNELLEKGELLENKIQAKLEARKMLKDKISAFPAFSALFALGSKLGFGNESRDQKIDLLSQRVDSLIEVVSVLAQQKETENKTTTVVSKKALTKKTAKPVAKASATKTPVKPRTRKTPSKLKADEKD